MKHTTSPSAALSLSIDCARDSSVLLTATVLLELLDVFVEFVEVLALSVELLLKLLQAMESVSLRQRSTQLLPRPYLSISFCLMKRFSEAASRLLNESLVEERPS